MAASSAPPRPLREEAWHFERQGFEPRIAQTLVAYEHGLRPVPSGWRLDELAACSSCSGPPNGGADHTSLGR